MKMSKKPGEFTNKQIEKVVMSMPIIAISIFSMNQFQDERNRKVVTKDVKKLIKALDTKKDSFAKTLDEVAKEATAEDKKTINAHVKLYQKELDALREHAVNFQGKMMLLDDDAQQVVNFFNDTYQELLEQVGEVMETHQGLVGALNKTLSKREWHKPKEKEPDIQPKEAPVTLEQLHSITRKVIKQYEGKMASRKARHKPSVIHHHGKKGLAAAKKLEAKLNSCESVPEYLNAVNEYIQDKKSPGKFNPGSFKTRMAVAFNNANFMEKSCKDRITRKDKPGNIQAKINNSCQNFLKTHYSEKLQLGSRK